MNKSCRLGLTVDAQPGAKAKDLEYIIQKHVDRDPVAKGDWSKFKTEVVLIHSLNDYQEFTVKAMTAQRQ